MKLAIVNMPLEYYNPRTGGAVSTVTKELTACLQQRGHEVSILTPVDSHPCYDIGRVYPVVDTTLTDKSFVGRLWGKALRTYYRWDYPRYSFYLSSVIATLRKLSPQDVVVVHNDCMMAYHLRAALGSSVMIVHYVHNEPKSGFRYLRKSTDATDLFVAVSNYIAGRIQTLLSPAPGRVTTVLNGVNLDRFRPADSAHHLNGQAGERKGCKALFVGRINKEKGPDVAVEAVRRLQAEGLSVTLDMAGAVWWHGVSIETDPFASAVKASIDGGVGTFLGDVPRDKMSDVMRQYDVLVVPSRWNDPCPLTVGEGLASGCAVAGSRRGGIPEIIGDFGELFDPEDPQDVCASLRRLVVDEDYRKERRRQARQRAEQLTWTRAALEFEQALLSRRKA